jgi:hypothetical protein
MKQLLIFAFLCLALILIAAILLVYMSIRREIREIKSDAHYSVPVPRQLAKRSGLVPPPPPEFFLVPEKQPSDIAN